MQNAATTKYKVCGTDITGTRWLAIRLLLQTDNFQPMYNNGTNLTKLHPEITWGRNVPNEFLNEGTEVP